MPLSRTVILVSSVNLLAVMYEGEGRPGRGWDRQLPGDTGGVAVGGAVLRHLKVAIWTLLLVTSFLTALWKLCISETDGR